MQRQVDLGSSPGKDGPVPASSLMKVLERAADESEAGFGRECLGERPSHYGGFCHSFPPAMAYHTVIYAASCIFVYHMIR